MATIVTRAGKGSELTHAELDANFTNLNNELAQALPNPQRFYVFEDYMGGSVPTFTQSVGGTGSSTNLEVGQSYDNVGLGWLRVNLGTTATGRCAQTTQVNAISLWQNRSRYRCRLRWLTLSSPTDRFAARIGFIDNVSGDTIDGALFRYVDDVNGGRFQCVTEASAVETAVDSGVTVAINTNYILEIIVDGGVATFYIDNALVATISTTLPTADGRETGAGFMAQKSIGTTGTTPFTVDYQLIDCERDAR